MKIDLKIEGLELSPPWRLLAVGVNAERAVARRLGELRVEFYVPIERGYVGSGPRRREHERPLVRGYVFARLDPMAFSVSAELPAARGLFTAVGVRQQRLVDKFIADLQREEANGAFDHVRRRNEALKPGAAVRVNAGPFTGMAAVIVELRPQRRCELVTSMFGREGRMTIEVDKLELAA